MNIEESIQQIETLIEAWQLDEADLNQTDINAMQALLKENQKLKKQVEDTITSYTEEHNLRHNFDLKLDVLETQQKEFINYLEDEIQQQETVIAENQEKLYFFKYEDEKEDLKLSSQRAYIRRIILEEILQKYKSIIGDYK